MKKLIVLLIAFSECYLGNAQAKKIYSVTSGEWIFSFANITDKGIDASSIIRFSPVFNFQNFANYDVSDRFGLMGGLAFRNVGFIYDVPNSNLRMKYRTYNIGIPVAVKIGNMNGKFLYAGYELEIPINFKTKTFTNEDKTDKSSVWFSNQVTTFNSAVFFGIQLPLGGNLKFKYYLSNFFNKDYTAQDAQGNPTKPYKDMNVNVFYFSLNFFILKNTHFYYQKSEKSHTASRSK
jgi:hypothetical protein